MGTAHATCQGVRICGSDYACGASDSFCPDDMQTGMCDECGECCDPDCGDCICTDSEQEVINTGNEYTRDDAKASESATTDNTEGSSLLSIFPKILLYISKDTHLFT
ncbi:hypothetical protein COV22_02180 [Candidatus Woesearchaeota archaeon CG10_big_fil_rev_8_21_14_0_10_47_5]|nr:MAG: hypothetical protein AUJ69_03410 [Candidatus Woesearchaeota archaeon CG1_02_47_18]PIN72837.1 MAG: hypothetical protein COV22_02180 [Candidatus Woesearchaeota archaeon CG10_big_fil_rev_8_21_14_0_10_47_5]HII29588.1 hypothetical protein [Candidatus Woesearchaeota archaeon]